MSNAIRKQQLGVDLLNDEIDKILDGTGWVDSTGRPWRLELRCLLENR